MVLAIKSRDGTGLCPYISDQYNFVAVLDCRKEPEISCVCKDIKNKPITAPENAAIGERAERSGARLKAILPTCAARMAAGNKPKSERPIIPIKAMVAMPRQY